MQQKPTYDLVCMALALRKRRTGLGLSVRKLAARAGCTPKSIYHVESGENFPSMKVYLSLCRALRLGRPLLT